jgi:hypothetical protein
MRLFFPICLVIAGCSDYDLSKKKDDPLPAEDTDTGSPPVDTAPPADTADSGAGGTVTDTGVVATEPVYINTSDTLFSYDPTTGRSTRIGAFLEGGRAVSGGMTDIAIDLSGHMFGVSFATLYRIDPTTAECTRVAAVDDQLTGLTFVSDGRLVGAGEAVSFVDTRTGALTPLVPTGEYSTSGDIVGLPDGMLYWTVTGGDVLIQVDPNSGDTRRRGSIGVSSVFGLGYAYGDLIGFTSGGRTLVIDDASGRVSDNAALSGTWWGATTNPVLW